MLKPERLPGWPDALLATLEHHRAQPFTWGTFDCATLFAESVKAVTGINPLHDINSWRSEEEAVSLLKEHRFYSMRAFCDHHFPAVPVSFARRGDLVLPASAPPIMCPAVVTGAEAVSRDLSGWVVAPLDAMTYAWKVG